MRLLVIEDYGPVRKAVTQALEEQGYAVDAAETGTDGLGLARDHSYDVIVLDLMLPGVDGLAILRSLREGGSKAGVLVLTARDTLADRVSGLDAGADDYLVKPFELAELLARVKSLLRRCYSAPNPTIKIGDLEVDTVRRDVRRFGEVITLSSREYALLEYLAHRAGELVSRTDIWEHVYDLRSDARSNVVDVYVGYLRKKLEREGSERLIHTRRGQGYMLGPGG